MRTILRRHGLERKLTLETQLWIAQHDEHDEQRIKREKEEGVREQLKQQALDKLNVDDRRILEL